MVVFALIVLAAPAALSQQSPVYQTPAARSDGWQTADADSVGYLKCWKVERQTGNPR